VSPAVPACWLAELPDPAEPVPLAAGVLLPELQAAAVRDSAASPAAKADRAVRRLVNICIMVNPLG
jgi:hypothetical protein